MARNQNDKAKPILANLANEKKVYLQGKTIDFLRFSIISLVFHRFLKLTE